MTCGRVEDLPPIVCSVLRADQTDCANIDRCCYRVFLLVASLSSIISVKKLNFRKSCYYKLNIVLHFRLLSYDTLRNSLWQSKDIYYLGYFWTEAAHLLIYQTIILLYYLADFNKLKNLFKIQCISLYQPRYSFLYNFPSNFPIKILIILYLLKDMLNTVYCRCISFSTELILEIINNPINVFGSMLVFCCGIFSGI